MITKKNIFFFLDKKILYYFIGKNINKEYIHNVVIRKEIDYLEVQYIIDYNSLIITKDNFSFKKKSIFINILIAPIFITFL